MSRTPQAPTKGGVAAPAFFLCAVAAGAGFAFDFDSAPIFGFPAALMAIAIGVGSALFAVCAAYLMRVMLKASSNQAGDGDAGADA
jgi:hypothetical protein